MVIRRAEIEPGYSPHRPESTARSEDCGIGHPVTVKISGNGKIPGATEIENIPVTDRMALDVPSPLPPLPGRKIALPISDLVAIGHAYQCESDGGILVGNQGETEQGRSPAVGGNAGGDRAVVTHR